MRAQGRRAEGDALARVDLRSDGAGRERRQERRRAGRSERRPARAWPPSGLRDAREGRADGRERAHLVPVGVLGRDRQRRRRVVVGAERAPRPPVLDPLRTRAGAAYKRGASASGASEGSAKRKVEGTHDRVADAETQVSRCPVLSLVHRPKRALRLVEVVDPLKVRADLDRPGDTGDRKPGRRPSTACCREGLRQRIRAAAAAAVVVPHEQVEEAQLGRARVRLAGSVGGRAVHGGLARRPAALAADEREQTLLGLKRAVRPLAGLLAAGSDGRLKDLSAAREDGRAAVSLRGLLGDRGRLVRLTSRAGPGAAKPRRAG